MDTTENVIATQYVRIIVIKYHIYLYLSTLFIYYYSTTILPLTSTCCVYCIVGHFCWLSVGSDIWFGYSTKLVIYSIHVIDRTERDFNRKEPWIPEKKFISRNVSDLHLFVVNGRGCVSSTMYIRVFIFQ